MRCPRCDAEYVAGIGVCADCDVPLVDAGAAAASFDRHAEPVIVFESGHPDRIAIAKSLLISSDIEFMVTGEHVQDLFGYGRFPAASNLVVGPMRVLVARDDAEDATVVLDGLDRSEAVSEAASLEQGAHPEDVQASVMWRAARTAAKIGIIIVLGITALTAAWAFIDNVRTGLGG